VFPEGALITMTIVAESKIITRAADPVQPTTPAAKHPRRSTAGPTVASSRRSQPVDAATTEDLLRRRDLLPAEHPDRAKLRARVIEKSLPLAKQLARRYAGRGELLDDLTQVAALAREVATATEKLSQRQGRSPSTADLADHLHVTADDLLAAIGARRFYHLASLNEPHAGADSADVVDGLGGIDPGYTNVDNLLSLQPLLAALPLRERRILTMRFYGRMTQTQIAEEVGLSQMHVSRLLTQILIQLRTVMLS
jgi:RNA polymerase sigma-B factor